MGTGLNSVLHSCFISILLTGHLPSLFNVCMRVCVHTCVACMCTCVMLWGTYVCMNLTFWSIPQFFLYLYFFKQCIIELGALAELASQQAPEIWSPSPKHQIRAYCHTQPSLGSGDLNSVSFRLYSKYFTYWAIVSAHFWLIFCLFVCFLQKVHYSLGWPCTHYITEVCSELLILLPLLPKCLDYKHVPPH